MTTKSRILLFKTQKEDGHDPYMKILNESRFEVECIRVLGFEFINLEKLRKHLSQPDLYSAVLLTSQRAVEAVAIATEDISETAWKKLPAYVVGMATGKLAEELGFETIKGTETGNAENLGNVIITEFSGSNSPILFPCANVRRETLPKIMNKHNIKFEDLPVYRTSADRAIKENLTSYLSKGHPDLVVYFSPSGVMATSTFWRELGLSISSLQCVAIGPTTEECLLENDYPIAATASHPTPESVLEAILNIKPSS